MHVGRWLTIAIQRQLPGKTTFRRNFQGLGIYNSGTIYLSIFLAFLPGLLNTADCLVFHPSSCSLKCYRPCALGCRLEIKFFKFEKLFLQHPEGHDQEHWHACMWEGGWPLQFSGTCLEISQIPAVAHSLRFTTTGTSGFLQALDIPVISART